MENVVESNKLIAEFMGLKMHDSLSVIKTPLKCYEWDWALYSLAELKFHESWDWLMPVVQKVKKIYPSENTGINLQKDLNIALNIKCTISDVNKVVIEFIKWHNLKLVNP